jgi:hypothetical protein
MTASEHIATLEQMKAEARRHRNKAEWRDTRERWDRRLAAMDAAIAALADHIPAEDTP